MTSPGEGSGFIMSHKIEVRDLVFLARIPELFDGKGWHKKGTPYCDFTREGLAKVLWAHEMRDAGILMPDGTFYKTGERYAISLDDNLPCGGAVGDRWESPVNGEFFDLFSEALSGSRYSVVSCGTVGNREQFFIDAKGENIKAGKRDFAPFVGLHRGFGGLSSLTVSGHGAVIQCANTTALFLREADKADDTIRAKNTVTLKKRLPEIKKAIEDAHGVNAQFAAAMADSETIPVREETAGQAFVGFMGGRLTTRAANRANRLLQLFKGGAGNRGESVADWFNSVTDFYSHESAGSVDASESVDEFLAKQFASSEFGSGRKVKASLAKGLFQGGRVDAAFVPNLASEGRRIIERADREIATTLSFQLN